MKQAKFGSLGKADIWKTALIVALSTCIAALGKLILEGGYVHLEDIKVLAITGLSAGTGYIIKNLFTNSDDEFMSFEKEDQLPKN